jgi:TP901 family phage tail tape measure protein
MARIDKVINVKIEGVAKIRELENSLKKLRAQQKNIKKDLKDGENAGKFAEKQYKKTSETIKEQSTQLRGLRKEMSGVNNQTKKAGGLQKSMTSAVIKGAAAFTILLTAFRRINQAMTTMIGTFSDFEFTMAKVKAVSGATGDEFKKLTESAERLGRSTFFTASQVAELQLNFSKLGFTTEEILVMQEATINLSIATGSDLARAATVAGASVRGFQLEAEEATRVIDVMALAFTSSALDIEKWNTSMTKVAPIASMAGFTIEETTAIMAKLSDTGIEASIAGTSLRNIFLKMQDPASELSKRVGHTITNLDQMLEVFKDLQEGGTDLADILSFMDVRQVAAFGTMLEGADDIRELRDELLNAEGAGQDMADTVGDTLQGSIFKVKSAFEGLSIAIVKNFGGALQKTLENLAEFLNNLADNDSKLRKVGRTIKNIIKTLAAYVIGVKAAVLWTRLMSSSVVAATKYIGVMASAARAATIAYKALRAAALSTAIGAAVMIAGEAIGRLVTGVSRVDEELEEMERKAQERIQNIKNFLGDVYDEGTMKSAFTDATLELTKATLQYDQLLKAKKEIIEINRKLDESEGNELLNLKNLKIAQSNFATSLKETNKFLDANNQALLTEDSTLKDIKKSLDSVTEAYFIKAIAQEYTKAQSQIVAKTAEAQIEMQKRMDLFYDENSDFEPGYTWRGMDSSDIDKVLTESGVRLPESKTAEQLMQELSELEEQLRQHKDLYTGSDTSPGPREDEGAFARRTQIESQIRLLRGIASYTPTGGMSLTDLYDIGSEGEMESQLELLKNVYEGLASGEGFSLESLLSTLGGGTTSGEPTSVSAEYTMQEKITAEQANVEILNDELQHNINMLEAKKKGIQAFRKQKNVSDEEDKRAQLALNKTILDLNKNRYRQEIKLLNDTQEQEKIDIKNRNLAKEEEAAQLAQLDIDYNELRKQIAESYGLDFTKISNEIANDELALKEANIKKELKALEDSHTQEKLDNDLALANKEITEGQHKENLLLLEANYLQRKFEILTSYDQQTTDVENQQKANQIKRIREQSQALNDYIGVVGQLGGHLTDVAGEEEKFNIVRQTGIVITQAAATAEKILAIANTMTELSAKRKALAEAFGITTTAGVIAADGAKSASNIALAGSGFLAAIANSIKSLPFPFNLFAIGAIIAAIFGAKRAITSGFKGADPSGSGSPSVSGSGGGSGGGQMALMTFGGRHQTIGQTSQYRKGGMVYGPSHAQGGVKYAVGGRVIELEGGEAIINKKSTSMFRGQLSTMNQAGGGVKFADGGVANMPSFANTQFQVEGQKGMMNVMGGRSKVIVVESDITNTQDKVKAIESEVSF